MAGLERKVGRSDFEVRSYETGFLKPYLSIALGNRKMAYFFALGCMVGLPFELSRRLKNALGDKPTEGPPLPEPHPWTTVRDVPAFAKGRALDIDIWAANREYLNEDVWFEDRDGIDTPQPMAMPREIPRFKREVLDRYDNPRLSSKLQETKM